MLLRKGNNGERYTPQQIRMSKPKIVYWIHLPKRIEKKKRWGTISSNLVTARNFKQALKLARKYHAETFHRCTECKLGRWFEMEYYTKTDWR
jgi:hypothetical protein